MTEEGGEDAGAAKRPLAEVAPLADVAAGRTLRGEHARAGPAAAGSTAAGARIVLDASGRAAVVPAGAPAPLAGVGVERDDRAEVGNARVLPGWEALPPGSGLAVLAEDNAFAVARWALPAGHAFVAGPESERWIALVAGSGLLFLDHGDTLRLDAGALAVVRAGERARVWARDDARGLVVQPQGAAVPRRTLRSEVERLRAAATKDDARDAR